MVDRGYRSRDQGCCFSLVADPGRGGFKTGVRNLRSLLEQNVTHAIVAFRTRIEMDSSTVISIVCFSQ